MLAPVDQTTVYTLTGPVTPAGAVAESLAHADDFLRQSGLLLGDCLEIGPMQAGMVKSSAFCALLEYNAAGLPVRGLLSPEDLTVTMATKVLAEATDD